MRPTERTPVEAGARASRMNSTVAAAGVAFGLTWAGLGVAAAQTDSTGETTTTTRPAAAGTPTTAAPPTEAPATPPATAAPADRPAPAGRPAETPLQGDVADRVRAAALEAVPGGTVLRLETDSEGSPYEAHVRRADGTEVVVKVDEAFEVTSVEEHMGRGGHRGGGPAPNLLSGEAAEKATAAARAAVEGGTVIRVQGEPGGSGYHAHLRRADGTEVVVRMDADFDVTGTEDAPAAVPGSRVHRGPRPGDGTSTPTTTA